MSTDDALTIPVESKSEMADVASPSAEAPMRQPAGTRKRPRLNLGALGGPGAERKRGKSMFGIVLGTLNKAKVEDKERNASEAAKKRQLIEQRLQLKLRKETDSVRRAEEAKKDKTLANRKEEDLQLKDSIYKLRHKRLPLLANFLLTTDVVPDDDSSPPPPSTDPLAPLPRTHPPPLYYLPAVLTPAQEAFLARRKAEVVEMAEKEWNLFKQERETGIAEINELRRKVTDEEARQKTEREAMDADAPPNKPSTPTDAKDTKSPSTDSLQEPKDSAMDVDDGLASKPAERPESEKKDEPAMQADDDDAVEY